MKFKLSKFFFLFTIALTSLSYIGCDSDNGTDPETPKTKFQSGVIVLNDGKWGQNNSEITLKSFLNDTVYNNLYKAVNGETLGDTGNDIKIEDGKVYIVVSESKKIQVVSLGNFISIGKIDLSAYGKPRHITFANGYGYATVFGNDGTTDGVVKFDLTSKTVLKFIKTDAKPEDIVAVGNYIYTANSGYGIGNTVSIIDVKNDVLTKTLTVALDPQYMTVISNYVYVSCAGSYTDLNAGSGLWKINPTTNTVIDSIKFNGNPTKVTSYKPGYALVLNSYGVVNVDLNGKNSATLIPVSSVSTSSYPMVYSVAYDATADEIYCANPKDFKQNGEIIVFSADGKTVKRKFDCGINPSNILVVR